MYTIVIQYSYTRCKMIAVLNLAFHLSPYRVIIIDIPCAVNFIPMTYIFYSWIFVPLHPLHLFVYLLTNQINKTKLKQTYQIQRTSWLWPEWRSRDSFWAEGRVIGLEGETFKLSKTCQRQRFGMHTIKASFSVFINQRS